MKTSAGYFEKVNKLDFDEYGRASGVLLIDKPAGISAHDVVDVVRKLLSMKKVGHAGALDVFASGLQVVLVGKATKSSDELLNLGKRYKAEVLIGVSTETQDPEGKIVKIKNADESVLSEEIITSVLKSFVGGYDQFVSSYSSVKVGGLKLRKVMRDKSYVTKLREDGEKRFIDLYGINSEKLIKSIEIPRKKIDIIELNLLNMRNAYGVEMKGLKLPEQGKFIILTIEVKCSKGTYIRQLAEDIGEKLKYPAMLISLRRTEVGKFKISECLELDKLTPEGLRQLI